MSETLSEALERLQFHLDNQTGFWFALVATDVEAPRARMREVTEAWCKANGVPFFFHALDPIALVPLGIELSRGGKPGIHWIRADGVKGTSEEWDKHATLLFMAMNERRDAYRKRHEGAIVVEGRASLKPLLRDLAPDLFSIRAFIAEPSEESEVERFDVAEGQEKAPFSESGDWYIPDPDLMLQQAARLDGQTDHESIVDRVMLRAEAVFALLRANRVDDAKATADALEADAGAILRLSANIQRRVEQTIHHANLAFARTKGDLRLALIHADHLVHMSERYSLYVGFQSVRYAERARIRAALGDHEGASEDLRNAVRLDGMDLDADPQNPRLRGMFLAHSIELSKQISRNIGLAIRLKDERVAVLRRALDRLDEWDAEKPGEIRWLYERCRLEQHLALASLTCGDMRGGKDWMRRAFASAERCRQRDPIDRDIRILWFTGRAMQAASLAADRDTSEEALKIYQEILAEIAELLRARSSSKKHAFYVFHVGLELAHATLLEIRGERRRAGEALGHAGKRLGQMTRQIFRKTESRVREATGKLLGRV